jgi:hypothetical protein
MRCLKVRFLLFIVVCLNWASAWPIGRPDEDSFMPFPVESERVVFHRPKTNEITPPEAVSVAFSTIFLL